MGTSAKSTPDRKKPEPPPLPLSRDISPSRYIARIDRVMGEEVPGLIDPEELLVHAHRDRHPVEIAAQFIASRLVRVTRDEELVRRGLRAAHDLGMKLAESVGSATGSRTAARLARKALGVVERDVVFQFREPSHLSERQVRSRIARLQGEARKALAALGRARSFRLLVTGATGFLGKEILAQVADDPRIEEVVALVRPETVRDPRTRAPIQVLSPGERGAHLLRRLGIAGARARKFRFVKGDVEQPGLGLDPAEAARLRGTLTHVVHCAASVAFDDPYERSYRANVLGCMNALEFSLGVQKAPGSRFVHHVAIETSYIHGRRKKSIAQESALVFPRHFYNNYYELTKAMASIETDRFVIEKGLRVAQLLPSIVIGHARTGNNRGDTKVVNAPINAFGRAKEAAEAIGEGPKAWLLRAVVNSFPGDPSAELNLVPVDRVVAGIRAALAVPEAVGIRIHLATDNRIRSEDMVRTVREELGVSVRLADPTLYRNFTLPVVKGALERMGEPKLAAVLEKLGTIFGGYGEWGQPVHEVGNDVRVLGLSLERPRTRQAFRMLCRHNRYVQDFGRVRDPDEVARRETIWERAVDAVERTTGRRVASLSPGEFRQEVAAHLDLRTFRARRAAARRRRR
jgi:nucleoside-diphosphate-sugar epimerase